MTSTIECAWCGEPAGLRLCPRDLSICGWCCCRCAAEKCARGIYRTLWPAAVRVALELRLVGDSLADAVERFVAAYRERLRLDPEPPMLAAARFVLVQRLTLQPPPSSADASEPLLLLGLPDR